MKILLVHNFYEHPGGEDHVFNAEKALLLHYGHKVIEYVDNNKRLTKINVISNFINSLWSKKTIRHLNKILRTEKPDIVHFHNIFFAISPSAYYACKKLKFPVVQTLHNYRLICSASICYRNNRLCEECYAGKMPYRGILHACYRGSRLQTFGITLIVSLHRWLGTWQKKIDLYIALSNFASQLFIENGVARKRIVIKSNFVYPDPGMRDTTNIGKYALFVGRLTDEKGVLTLLKAWDMLHGIPLKIVGDGRLFTDVKKIISENSNKSIELLKWRNREETFKLMKASRFLVFPSEWYECFPLVLIETFACGVPVIASRLGAMKEIITDNYNGILFTPGNTEKLAEKIAWAWKHEDAIKEMGRNARKEFELKYTGEKNYGLLINIYKQAIAHNSKR
ncbi:MAG: glycosyltransferase family 4 protein [Candidatus Omnitrophica bacterium]|nr:glycosyltransferase family 4 protein [Candidatus Omnitrophota bacterium]